MTETATQGSQGLHGIPAVRPWVFKAYLAAPSSYQPMMREWRADLAEIGCTVTSRWLDRAITGDFDPSLPHWRDWALEDIQDVINADVVISCTLESTGRGGRHAEFGMGIAFGRQAVIIGRREHIFHCLPAVPAFPDWVTFILSVQSGDWAAAHQ